MKLTPEQLSAVLSQLNDEPPKTENNWLAQHWLSVVILIALSGFALLSFHLSEDDAVKIWNKLFNVSVFWMLATLFEIFYNGTHYNVNEKISSDARSLSTYIAAVLIGTAVIVALS